MDIFLILIALFFSYKIFRKKEGYKKLLWTIIGLIILNSNIIVLKYPVTMTTSRFLIFSLLISELWHFKDFTHEFKKFPAKNYIIFLVISILLITITDSRLSLFYRFYHPFCELTDQYFILFLGYYAITYIEDIQKMAKPILFTLIGITIYGIFTYITKSNPYGQFVIENFMEEESIMMKLKGLTGEEERFRVYSTFSYSFVYGYASSLLALFSIYIHNKKIFRKLAIIGIFAGLTGAFLCASRTVFLAMSFAFVIYFFFAYNMSKKISFAVISIFLGILIYSSVPIVSGYVDNALDVFITGGKSTAGSSFEMRNKQLMGATAYFANAPLFGNGYGYIDKELGWGDRENSILDENMYGYESIIFLLLIEQGLAGLLSKFVFFFFLLIYCFRNLKTDKHLATLGLSVMVLFLAFSIGTGALGTWPLTMLFMGIIMKTLELKKLSDDD